MIKSTKTKRAIEILCNKPYSKADQRIINRFLSEFEKETNLKFEADDFLFMNTECSIGGFLCYAQFHAYETFNPKISYYITTEDDFIKVWR